jgi:hypothetical protein
MILEKIFETYFCSTCTLTIDEKEKEVHWKNQLWNLETFQNDDSK